jgi:hypothetical protein
MVHLGSCGYGLEYPDWSSLGHIEVGCCGDLGTKPYLQHGEHEAGVSLCGVWTQGYSGKPSSMVFQPGACPQQPHACPLWSE